MMLPTLRRTFEIINQITNGLFFLLSSLIDGFKDPINVEINKIYFS